MSTLPESLRELVATGPLAHLATIDPDGSPQVTVIWVGLDGDDLVSGHLSINRKIRNIQRDPRVTLSLEAPREPGVFLAEHAVLRATATVEEGAAAWELLDRLGRIYVAADFVFPNKRPGGYVLRYRVDRVGGVGPWVPTA